MTTPTESIQPQENALTDKEINFQKQRKMYERMIEEERAARAQAEEKAAQLERMSRGAPRSDDDDDDSEPYVDHKKLEKKLASFEKVIEEKIDKKAEAKAAALLEAERRTHYLRENADFNNVMSEQNIEKFAQKHPRVAEAILKMPDGFERQKLVYETMKDLGIDRPETKTPSIQDKIEANRRSPYYQPSGVANAPYAAVGDFSAAGQKSAYEKLQQLKKRLGG